MQKTQIQTQIRTQIRTQTIPNKLLIVIILIENKTFNFLSR